MASTTVTSNIDKNGLAFEVEDNATSKESSLHMQEKIFNTKLDRNLLWKMDLILVPSVGMLYLLAFLDRSNIGNARVAGLQADLGLTDIQYQTAITLTYVPYIAAELPSNLIINKVGPHLWLPILCVTWGIVTTLQCQIHNYAGLLACRFFLGLCEGGLFPGIVLYLSAFYRRHELQVRIGFFFSGAALSGAFSGLLAAAIVNMDGLANMKGWQWIFCLEGIFSFLFGACMFFVLPRNPESCKWFTPEQRDRCVERIAAEQKFIVHERITVMKVLSAFAEFHIITLCLAIMFSGLAFFGLAYFTPSIVATFGYGTVQTQLLTVPPYAAAFIVTMIVALISDRYKCRGLAAFVMTCVGVIGAALNVVGRTLSVRYAGLFLLIVGVYSAAPCLTAWMPNNTAGAARRATGIAMAFMSTNIGGIISSWIYPRATAPYYTTGSLVTCIGNGAGAVLTLIQLWNLYRMNKQKIEKREEILSKVAHLTEEEQIAALGDHHPDFKYTY